MPLTDDQTHAFADRLHAAAMSTTQVTKLTDEAPELSLEDAYTIQRLLIARRITDGARLIGMKMGLTSLAKMEQMGVHAPIYGHLTSDMLHSDGAILQRTAMGQPRVEPEIAFLLGRDLEGPTTAAQAMLAVSGVCAAIEVIDSRYEKFRFTLNDVVADNASSTAFVLGSTVVAPGDLDLGNLGMVMEIDGETVAVGSSAAIYEHPARSLAELANLLAERGERLEAGMVVLAGGATAAKHVEAGQRVRLRCDGLGTVDLSIR